MRRRWQEEVAGIPCRKLPSLFIHETGPQVTVGKANEVLSVTASTASMAFLKLDTVTWGTKCLCVPEQVLFVCLAILHPLRMSNTEEIHQNLHYTQKPKKHQSASSPSLCHFLSHFFFFFLSFFHSLVLSLKNRIALSTPVTFPKSNHMQVLDSWLPMIWGEKG